MLGGVATTAGVRTSALHVDVLGPLVARHDGRLLEVSGARRRALLAFLALAGGRPVAVSRIVDVLADGATDDHGIATLRTYMSKLRADLGAAASALRTVDGGYVLETPPEAVDALRLRELVGAARTSAAHERLDLATEALALWRGDPLPELATTRWGRAEATVLTSLWVEATALWAGAQMELGDNAAASGALRDLLREHPHREDLAAVYMKALYRSARQSEALAYYPLIRQRLRDDLGVEPSRDLADVYAAILTHAPDLDAPTTITVPWQAARTAPLIGRDDELGAITAAFDRVQATGSPHVVVLTGEAGIGKTRLATEFCDLARARGATVLAGRASELPAPYQPVAECLAAYVAMLPSALVTTRLGPGAQELVRLVPDLVAHLPDSTPGEPTPAVGRRRLAHAVGGWWQSASTRQPLVLLLDDLENVDEETTLLLRDAVTAAGQSRVLIVVALRDTGLPDNHPARTLIAALRRQGRLVLAPVGPLDESAIAALAEAADVAADPVQLVADTGGNAFFVMQWLAATAAREPAVARGARAGIGELVRERLTQLPPQTVEALMAASVVGEMVELERVAAAWAHEPEVTADHLAAAVGAHLLEEASQGAYHFIHGLVREALLERWGPTQAAAAHRRVAEHLESSGRPLIGATLHAVAQHHAAGVTAGGDASAAISSGLLAGEAAASRLALQAAFQCFDAALAAAQRGREPESTEDELAATELLLRHGEVASSLNLVHDVDGLVVAAREAHTRGDEKTFVRAALALGRRRIHGGVVDDDRVAVLREALESPEADDATRALLLTGVAAERGAYEPHVVMPEITEAWALAARCGDDAVRTRVLTVRNMIISEVFDAQSWFVETAVHLAVARRLGDPLAACEATTNRLVAALCVGDGDEASDSLVEVERLSNELGGADRLFWAGACRAMVLLQEGQVDGAEVVAQEALSLGREAAIPEAPSTIGATIQGIRFEQGRMSEVLPILREPIPLGLLDAHRTIALTHAAAVAGELDEAREGLRRAAATGFEHLHRGRFALLELTWLGAAAWRLGEVETVARIAPVMASWSPRFVYGGGAMWGHVHHHLGVLLAMLDDPRAEWLLRSAEQAHRGAHAPAWVARSLAHRGRFAEAADIAGTLGLAGLDQELAGLRSE
jgi:DNA-binding SARP family transcriptional activator